MRWTVDSVCAYGVTVDSDVVDAIHHIPPRGGARSVLCGAADIVAAAAFLLPVRQGQLLVCDNTNKPINKRQLRAGM